MQVLTEGGVPPRQDGCWSAPGERYMNQLYRVLLAGWIGCGGLVCGVWAGGTHLPGALGPQSVAVVDAAAFSTDERLTAVCLQGLLNREGAKVFLNFGGNVDTTRLRIDLGPTGPLWGQDSFAALTNRFDSLYDIWVDELSRQGLCRFKPAALDELLRDARKKGILKGVVLYSKVDDDLAVAANYSALNDVVPVTPAVYTKWVEGKGVELPTLFDVRTLYPSYAPKEPKRLEAHRWAVTNLFPRCDHSAAFSRDRTYGQDAHDTLIDIDLAIQQRYFVYNLSHLSPETRNPGDRPHRTCGFNLPDRELLVSILGGLKPFSMVYGWGSPDENNFARRATIHDCAVICTLNGNGSFFRKLPAQATSFAQPSRPAGKMTLEQKIYVTFMVNEGDSLKCLATLGNQAGWMQPERGQIPINWGIDPYLYETFPGLVGYYYATATTNDYFFTPASGWGYAHPGRMATNSLIPYARKVAEAARKAHQSYIDIWWMGDLKERGLFFPFLRETGMRGLTQWSGQQSVEYSPLDGTPVIYSGEYYTLLMGDPVKFADKLIGEAKQVKAPWFIVVYGGWPYKFCEVARQLPEDKFKVVLLDEFFEAARLARPQVEGRVWKDEKRKQEAAPGAGGAQVP